MGDPNMAEEEKIIVACNFTDKNYYLFSIYEVYYRRKYWKSLMFFALFMFFLSVLCLLVPGHNQKSLILGLSLFASGILIPISVFVSFLFSVGKEISKHNISRDHTQYYITFTPRCVSVLKGKQVAEYIWADVSMLVVSKTCAFLYIKDRMAFILPEGENYTNALNFAKNILSSEKIISFWGKKEYNYEQL